MCGMIEDGDTKQINTYHANGNRDGSGDELEELHLDGGLGKNSAV